MDHNRAREREAQCIQEQPPACTAACPLHVDVRKMIACINRGDFTSGFAVLSKTVPFPRIISRICDHPCQDRCKRTEAGEAIMINALERACVDYGDKLAKITSYLPQKDKRVAVVGAGLSGLMVAFDLAFKGYQIVIFEASDRMGGRIGNIDEQTLPKQMVDDDLRVLSDFGVEIIFNSYVSNESGYFDVLCAKFDAVYLGIGPKALGDLQLSLELAQDCRILIEPVTFTTSHAKVFAGGGQRYNFSGFSPLTSILDGRRAAVSIDRFLQGASLSAGREKEGPFETRLYTNTQGIEPLPSVPLNQSQGYIKEAAIREAKRCLLCECLECVKACEYLAHFGSYPKRYVREIFNNDAIIMGMHQANRMINSCSLCGLCQVVCPENFNMGEICLEARQSMVKKEKMPPSAYDFALKDMEFSNSSAFALARNQSGFSTSNILFFPGCQLGASSPEYVEKVYAYLKESIAGGIGLMLGCCGAPANWAGQQDLFQQTIQSINKDWNSMGKPRVITACSTCYHVFKDNMPEVPVESLWTLLDSMGLSPGQSTQKPKVVAVHDPCTTRDDPKIQNSIRNILAKIGIQVQELDYSRNLTSCCGYGGLMTFANPKLAEKVVKRRSGESDADFLTYCAMCRDSFAGKGKRTLHILDLLFGKDLAVLAMRKKPSYSKRHENRAKLKAKLLQEVWGESVGDGGIPLEIAISEEVLELMENRMILIEDIEKVIRYAEGTGKKLQNKETGHFIAHFRPVSVTYWVEYSPHDSGFDLHNVYSHRMEVIEEVGQ